MKRCQTIETQQDTQRRVTEASLAELSAFVAQRMGLRFPRDRWDGLERGLRSAAREFGFEDIESCAQWVISSPLSKRCTEILASHLTIGETYFFRDQNGLDTLEQHILPDLLWPRHGRNNRMKIWSAGCCTGEEPYSIAILLDRVVPNSTGWNIDIVATDINTRFLIKASRGTYTEWSFRQTPRWVRDTYFRKTGNGMFEILPRVNKMVDFKYLNLAEDVYPSSMNNLHAVDVIFCRNVLMYFVPEQALKVLHGFYRTLVDGGWLIVGPSDLMHVKQSEFTLVDSKNPNLYRKGRKSVSAGQKVQPPSPALRFEPPEHVESARSQPARVAAKPRIRHPRAEQSPEDDTQYERALELYEAGHYEETVDRLIEWLSNSTVPDTPHGRDGKGIVLMARACANQGHLDEALTWCDKAIATDKLKPTSHYLRASILQEQGQIGDAANSLRQTLFLDPDFVLGHFTLGNLARSQDRIGESNKHFANALRLLDRHSKDSVLPESEGVTAGRLAEIIASMTEKEL